MDWFNFTTVATQPTTEWAAWSEYESEYYRATKAGGVVGPIVGSVVVIAFIISLFCFTSHMRRRRQELASASRRENRRQGRTAFVIGHSHNPDWVGEGVSGNDVSRMVHDLPPPYSPPYESELKDGDLPPSYADAVDMFAYNSVYDDVTQQYDENDVTQPDDENDVIQYDYDTDNMTDYSVDESVNYDVAYDADGGNETENDDEDDHHDVTANPDDLASP
ncbi:uncharacterized protein LOC132544917 [Ylistrum balloti]|uniref:uncharacterized protein LOC132544917 n=1 Tax=Ylistrum balloti TaxID=509963 RepID=UPI0029058F52|nr:uncharacterized protein LOC132544917 [Ylistrum balloti]